MDAEHTTEGSALRPVRRTDKLIVREVGDELVAYALDTEQVTALDPTTAVVWNHLDGGSTLDEIADASHLTTADVETAVMRLDQADLLAGGFDRRKFMRLAAAGASAGALLAITAPAAMAAGSNRKLTITSSCTLSGPPNKSATISFSLTGTSYPPTSTVTINVVLAFVGQTGGSKQIVVTVPANGTFAANSSIAVTDNASYSGKSYSLSASDSLSPASGVASVTATGSGIVGTC